MTNWALMTNWAPSGLYNIVMPDAFFRYTELDCLKPRHARMTLPLLMSLTEASYLCATMKYISTSTCRNVTRRSSLFIDNIQQLQCCMLSISQISIHPLGRDRKDTYKPNLGIKKTNSNTLQSLIASQMATTLAIDPFEPPLVSDSFFFLIFF